MHFVIYKNSILATLCSMTGAAFAAMGVLAMINGELNILSGTGVIAAGIALMVLADFISRRKAGRTRRKAQQAAFNAAPSARSSHRPTAGAQPFSAGKPVNKSAVAAGLFFLMALLLGAWAMERLYSVASVVPVAGKVMECAAYLMLMLGCFAMKRTQKVNIAHLIGIALLMGVYYPNVLAFLRMSFYRELHFEEKLAMAVCIGKAAAFLLLFLFACMAMGGKKRFSGLGRALWFLPGLLLAVVCFAQSISDFNLYKQLQMVFVELKWLPTPLLLELFRDIDAILATLLLGFGFRCLSRTPAVVYQQPVQPQPEPQYTAPEPSPDAAAEKDTDVEKQIQACRDLLECGILPRAECEQKIRELTQRYYGG